jgi:hypothetical protein
VLGLYAGLLDDRIAQLISADPSSSHWRGPALMNVLRITDTPEAAAAFLPRRLTFLRVVPEGFELTRRIAGLTGAAESVSAAPSMPDALGLFPAQR